MRVKGRSVKTSPPKLYIKAVHAIPYGAFLKWGVPLNYPFIDRYSMIHHPFGGTPFVGTSILYCFLGRPVLDVTASPVCICLPDRSVRDATGGGARGLDRMDQVCFPYSFIVYRSLIFLSLQSRIFQVESPSTKVPARDSDLSRAPTP